MAFLEKGKISSTQLIFLIISYNVAISVIITVGAEAKQDAWLAVLLGTLISIGLAWFYLALANRFPGKTLIAIHDIVWGPFWGKLYSIIFLIFFLHENSLLDGAFIYFQKEFLLNTPALILAFLGVGLAVLLASRGLEVLARCNQLIVIFCSTNWIILFFMILPEIRLSNFQPVLQTPFSLLVRTTLRCVAFNFSTGYIFLMVFPYVSDNHKIFATIIKGGAISALILLMGIVMTTGVLGPATNYFVYPALSATRLINIGELFSRMEIFTGVVFWIGCFALVSLQLYSLIMASSELLQLKSFTLALPLGILVALLSTHNFLSINDQTFFAEKVYIWEAFPFQYIFPALLYLTAVIRKLPRKDS
jgi:spore germination protein KB